MSKIAVLGAYGLVGATLCERLAAVGHVVLRQGRREGAELRIDPTDVAALRATLNHFEPEVVINLVAATNVDACEKDPQAAYMANVRPVEALVEAMAGRPVAAPHLIQVSSDQVYDGPGPHREADARPCNVYALSKYTAERVALYAGGTVLRTNLFGRSHAPVRVSFSDWIVNSLRTGTRITVFDDVFFSALHLNSLSDVIACAVQQRRVGVFNAGCSDGISKADFAFRLAEKVGLDRSLLALGQSRGAELRARRPLDMRMDASAFERAFGMKAPTMASQIDIAAREYLHEQA